MRSGIPVIAGFYTQPENIIRCSGWGWLIPVVHIIYLLWRWLFYRNFSHIHCLSKSAAAQLRAHGYKAWLHVISNEPSSLECSTGRMESIYSSLPKNKTGMNMPNACCFNCFPDCSIQVLPYLSCNFGCVLFWEPESEEKEISEDFAVR